MKQKRDTALYITLLHVISTIVIQYVMAVLLIGGKVFVETYAPIGFTVWMLLLFADFFLYRVFVKKYGLSLKKKHIVFLHIFDLFLILPVLFVLFVFLTPFSGMYYKLEAYEIVLTVGILVTDALLIIERMILIFQKLGTN